MNYLSIKIFSIYTYVLNLLLQNVVKIGNIYFKQGLFFYLEFALRVFRGSGNNIRKSADMLFHVF